MTLPPIHFLHVPGFDPFRDLNVGRYVSDSELRVTVHADPTREGLLQNWTKALFNAQQDETDSPWAVILSDDAVPLEGWKDHLRACLANAPAEARFIGLTHFSSAGARLARKGAPFGLSPHACWGGGIAYRREHLAPLEDYARKLRTLDPMYHKWDDGVIAAYNLSTDGLSALAVRALFGQPHSKSTLGHSPKRGLPQLTIEQDGPAWDAIPRAVPWKNQIRPIVHETVERMAR